MSLTLALAFNSGADTKPAKTDNAKASKGPVQISEKYDTKLPIEISSDKLEVHQQENRAIFTGNVIAVQGKIRLTSDVMIIHYRQQKSELAATSVPAAPPVAKPAPTASGTQGTLGAISLIEVEGNVFVATPEESAKGDKGNYQVDEKLLHLYGSNVILTRDKNILRGTELVYNLETGQSVLTNNNGKVNGLLGDHRVHGVFVPNESSPDKPKAKDRVSAKPAPTVTSPIAAQ